MILALESAGVPFAHEADSKDHHQQQADEDRYG
jgi:hypothetical protein